MLFTYYNPIYQRGFAAFVKEIADAGAKGLLVPDIPLEETDALSKICAKNGLDLVLLSTPTAAIVDRMEKIASEQRVHTSSASRGRQACAPAWSRRGGIVAKLKTVTDKPVCVGFEDSKEEQAQQVVRWGADARPRARKRARPALGARRRREGLARLGGAREKELRAGSNRDGAKRRADHGGDSSRTCSGRSERRRTPSRRGDGASTKNERAARRSARVVLSAFSSVESRTRPRAYT